VRPMAISASNRWPTRRSGTAGSRHDPEGAIKMKPMTTAHPPLKPPSLHHPVVVEHARRRAADVQLRIADTITAFAGSMPFVYIHAVVFACWMLFVETDPWPKLTLIVSLEAIFLSAFVMIGQNRQSEFQRAKADHDFTSEAQELRVNTELTREIHTLTAELHRHVLGVELENGVAGDENPSQGPGA
jgi:hypothetical protein